jgi:D-serine dehydratase
VWGVVLSRPEPGLALVGAGKRDVSFDVELPRPLAVDGAGGPRLAHAAARVVALNDQHAYLHLDPDDPLAVGELVCLGISHPCTTFDRWRVIPVVEDDYAIVGAVTTCF